MTNAQLSPEVEKRIDNIIAESEGISTKEVSSADQNKFRGGFSLGALVFGVFYFAIMKDRLYTILSIVFSLLFPPLLIALALNARRRAWESRKWINYNEFMKNQKLWDRAGLYGIVVSAILSWFVLQYIYSLISGLIPSGGANVGQLNEIKNNLENSLGN
jgi:hypothetical protein